jgi:hypothetical protein
VKNIITISLILVFSILNSQSFVSPKYGNKDEFTTDKTVFKTKDFNLFYLKPIQYIGVYKSKIDIVFNDYDRVSPILKNNYLPNNDTITTAYNNRNYENLKMYVDTEQSTPLTLTRIDTTKITQKEINYEMDLLNSGKKQTREIPYLKTYYEGFPVTIVNNTSKDEIIGFGNHIPLELEFLNRKNEWQEVYGFRRYSCSTGIKAIALKKNEMVTVFEPRLSGNFKTKFRYKLANLFSNEFEGSIDEAMLSK